MDNLVLLEHLRDLEVKLHHPDVRSNTLQLEALLHESFFEIGRSGKSYNKSDILSLLPIETPPIAIWSQDFTLADIADVVELLTYKSAYIDAQSELSLHTLRSSIWQFSESGWKMRFHQGTPTPSFKKTENELGLAMADCRPIAAV